MNTRLGECEVCGAQAAKYTCPKCEVKTCTLTCVNIHKKELECDGIRDPTKFVPISKFTNLDLLSDYRLMENITRSVETMKRDKSKRFTRINKHLPKHLFLLKRHLAKQQTKLEFLPGNFVQHKQNTTYLDFKTNIVYWRLEFQFVQANDFRVTSEKCDENFKLSTFLQDYFDPKTYPVEGIKYYQSAGLAGVNFYMKAVGKRHSKYYCLDPGLSLKENFRNKIIIEFPTIHIALKDCNEMYDLVNSDDENMELSKQSDMNATNYVEAIIQAEEKQNNRINKKENLLFVTEYSDEELSSE